MTRNILVGQSPSAISINPKTNIYVANSGSNRVSVYGKGSFPCREHTLSLSNVEFQYMGYSDLRGVLAEGMTRNEEVKETNLNKSIHEVQQIAREWYKKEKYDSICHPIDNFTCL
jgi:hypothetical protein